MIIDFSLWGWPQWVIVGLWSIGVIQAIVRHGEKKMSKYNAFEAIISAIILAFIYTKGGFFK